MINLLSLLIWLVGQTTLLTFWKQGKIGLAGLHFLITVEDTMCEEEYFTNTISLFKNSFSLLESKNWAIPSKKSKSCKSSGSRGRTSEKSSWFNSKSCGMSVISLAMSSGNSSALSSGVDGLLGKRTQLAPSRPLSLHTSVPKTRSSNVKMGNPSLKCLLFLLPEKEIYKQKEDLTILSHIAPKPSPM